MWIISALCRKGVFGKRVRLVAITRTTIAMVCHSHSPVIWNWMMSMRIDIGFYEPEDQPPIKPIEPELPTDKLIQWLEGPVGSKWSYYRHGRHDHNATNHETGFFGSLQDSQEDGGWESAFTMHYTRATVNFIP
jgi:hypothetical protein